MKRLLTTALMLLPLAGFAHPKGDSWFCERPAAHLAYAMTDEGSTMHCIYIIESVTSSNGRTTVNYRMTFPDTIQGEKVGDISGCKVWYSNGYHHTDAKASGNFGSAENFNVKGHGPILPLNPVIGEMLEDCTITMDMQGMTISNTFSGIRFTKHQSVSVEGGTFDAWCLEYNYTTKAAFFKNSGRYEQWFVKGIGDVLSLMYDKKGKVMSRKEFIGFKDVAGADIDDTLPQEESRKQAVQPATPNLVKVEPATGTVLFEDPGHKSKWIETDNEEYAGKWAATQILGDKALFLDDVCLLHPQSMTGSYLTPGCTVEFDYLVQNSARVEAETQKYADDNFNLVLCNISRQYGAVMRLNLPVFVRDTGYDLPKYGVPYTPAPQEAQLHYTIFDGEWSGKGDDDGYDTGDKTLQFLADTWHHCSVTHTEKAFIVKIDGNEVFSVPTVKRKVDGFYFQGSAYIRNVRVVKK